jgi:hypothetical protein
VQRELHGQLDLLADGRRERERVLQRELDLPRHLHRQLLGELLERHVRPPLRGRRRVARHPERRQLPLAG